MHYYQFNIADYRKDTVHLSMLEHGAYRQLLDWIYLDQKPIPKKTEVVFRRLSAKTEEEQNAILAVLNDMFFLTDDGYIQHRVMREIEAYQAKANRARIAGKLGGRPKKTEEVISRLSNETEEKANHKPLTINHNNKTIVRSTTSRFQEFWEAYPKTQRKVGKSACEKKWKMKKLDDVADNILNHIASMKLTKQWQEGFEPAPLTYINQSRWNDEVVSNDEALKPNEKPWFLVASQIEKKGKEIDLVHDPSTPFVYFRNEVYMRYNITPEMVRKAKIDWGEK